MNFLHTLYLSSIHFFKKCRISNPNIRFVQNRPKIHRWTEEELETLRIAVNKHGNKWKYISDNYFPLSRTPIAVQIRWSIINRNMSRPRTEEEDKILKYEVLISKPWTKEETEKLRVSILKYKQDWRKIADEFPDRSLFDIRKHHKCNASTNPNFKLGRWNDIEINLFKKAIKEHGKRWIKVSQIVGTRSPIQCIQFFNR
ncbi:hypothetical protein RhiirA5_402820 [Rhizophagus irregularis]|uniref:Homeodomain-like protein n=1 Tax=Rhizophagus irregularis TaxID=588596 RepID=A0A2N0P3S9_9GLOM|nr:hypothetical protein RhiirA5_402820 [Rhizophagus irregularis]UZO05841.1 hypothetical protein OCT59_026180 [Rhizophagus irregularis]CAB5349443.1 unnamed protein product [Rhizophagus irregularis]